jgi:hypothetical protein
VDLRLIDTLIKGCLWASTSNRWDLSLLNQRKVHFIVLLDVHGLIHLILLIVLRLTVNDNSTWGFLFMSRVVIVRRSICVYSGFIV